MSKVVIINHPLIQHKLSIVRNQDTPPVNFRALISEIGSLMTYEATRDLNVKEVNVKTPICEAVCHEISDNVVIRYKSKYLDTMQFNSKVSIL